MTEQTVSIRDYVDQGIRNLNENRNRTVLEIQAQLDRRFKSLEREQAAKEATLNERLEHLNQLRDALRDQQTLFVTSELFNVRIASLETQIADLQAQYERQRGRFSVYAAIGTILIIAITILELILGNVTF